MHVKAEWDWITLILVALLSDKRGEIAKYLTGITSANHRGLNILPGDRAAMVAGAKQEIKQWSDNISLSLTQKLDNTNIIIFPGVQGLERW